MPCQLILLLQLTVSPSCLHSIARQEVPANLVPWEEKFPSYSPPIFTAPFVLKAEWADPELGDFQPMFNSLDGKVNRKSHEKTYQLSSSKEPLNIRGRTGLKGRGVLGKWGPNHAADPVVTRWKRDGQGEKVTRKGKPVLQVVVIQRRDNKQWALPGGTNKSTLEKCQDVRRPIAFFNVRHGRSW